LNDDLMRMAKSGRWYDEHPHRALANISYVSGDQPPIGLFMKEWLSLYESRSGERGIFSRLAAQDQARKTDRRDADHEFGTNPCSEIILRNREVCNLTEVVVRATDDKHRSTTRLNSRRFLARGSLRSSTSTTSRNRGRRTAWKNVFLVSP
jgi:ribonucleoside-triphosphate reductase